MQIFIKMLSVTFLLFSFNCNAKIYLDLDLKTNEGLKDISYNKKFQFDLNKMRKILIPKSNLELEIIVTDHIPQSLSGLKGRKDLFLTKILLSDTSDTVSKNVISSKIISVLGGEAFLETMKNSGTSKKTVLKIKILK